MVGKLDCMQAVVGKPSKEEGSELPPRPESLGCKTHTSVVVCFRNAPGDAAVRQDLCNG